ncbi:unnamed protein product [Rotaria sp. Silwood2]|nr:unnamed protein product [Rotaria sp. Silwood2]CAF2919556.1 unnamed protein product [Rotaria sp. Silwood2]CAF3304466.1 unnamed protein product [Rotaria sp. Silwood2]CAF4294875.1 unnamed protein product [Rotaria sp. Silwood2]CAF4357716.1 unnamed protein product [Rotaria sp. Silwood2]
MLSPIMDRDEQQLKPTNEIVKLVLNSNSSLTTNTNPIQVEIQMPVHLEKVYMYEAETQTSYDDNKNNISDLLSKEAGDEARLTGSNKYGLLSLDEYQIMRTGEEHCLKKYFSDDDISLTDEEIIVEKQMKDMNLDEDRTVLIENLNNNASTILHTSHSNLSNTLLIDDTTHLSATLAQSTSSRISHSRYIQTFKDDVDDDDEELDQLIASTFTPIIEHEQILSTTNKIYSNQKNLSSIRCFVRQAIDSCRQNLTLVDQLLENIPLSSYEHILQRKVHRTNCIVNIPNTIKGLQYYPSTSVQTE